MLFSWSEIGKGGLRYFTNKINNKTIYLHRLVMGNPEGLTVDHINCNTLDCRKSNLRLATHRQQLANQRPKPNALVPLKGVYPSPNPRKYVARIRNTEGRSEHLGSFDTAEEAHKAYVEAAIKYHGEFART